MIEIGILGVLSGIAVAITFFLAYHLMAHLRYKNAALFWLGLSVIAIGLRIAKSIVFFIMNSMWPIGLSIGFFALASIGPLYLLYHQAVANKAFGFKPILLLHFIIPIAGAIACFIVTPHPLETTFYQLATLVLGVYIVLAHRKHHVFKYENAEERQWNNKTLILLWGIWFSFVFQHVAGSMIYYAYGSIIAAIFVFYILGSILSQPPIFTRPRRLNVQEVILEKVKNSFEAEKVYLSAGISVNILASQIDVPAYQITKAIRVLYDKTFPEALTYFRVGAFKEKISNHEHENLTIEYLAESSGFKTTSAFYSAFKKETGLTPTAFLESIQLKTA